MQTRFSALVLGEKKVLFPHFLFYTNHPFFVDMLYLLSVFSFHLHSSIIFLIEA